MITFKTEILDLTNGYVTNYIANLKTNLLNLIHADLQFTEIESNKNIKNQTNTKDALIKLLTSMEYSLQSGGKRFRPYLTVLICDCLGVNPKKALPLATAIELIHTYSLVHDDLPGMDNDNFRRGKPTNHKVYGEATAILTGDALLTESLRMIAVEYKSTPEVALELITLLTEKSGLLGMITGQAIDVSAKEFEYNFSEILLMHQLKTGALISTCTEGAAIVCGLTPEKRQEFKKFGFVLGLAFQVKDDILDEKDKKSNSDMIDTIGLGPTTILLEALTDNCKKILTNLGLEKTELVRLVDYNQSRDG